MLLTISCVKLVLVWVVYPAESLYRRLLTKPVSFAVTLAGSATGGPRDADRQDRAHSPACAEWYSANVTRNRRLALAIKADGQVLAIANRWMGKADRSDRRDTLRIRQPNRKSRLITERAHLYRNSFRWRQK